MSQDEQTTEQIRPRIVYRTETHRTTHGVHKITRPIRANEPRWLFDSDEEYEAFILNEAERIHSRNDRGEPGVEAAG